MRSRALDPDHTVIALGAGDISLARAAARGVDPGEVERALHDALSAGLELIEVEDDAERLAGDAVRVLRARDRAVIATRVPAIAERSGQEAGPLGSMTRGRSGVPTRDVLPERLPVRYVQERVEASLRATRLEALPLAQLAVRAIWRASSAWPELAGTCARLVREGKVLRWGALVETIEDDTAELAGEPWLTTIAAPLSLCERAAEPLLATRLAVLAHRPLAGGALAGALGPGVKLASTDDRRALDDRQLETSAVIAAKLAALVKREPPAARSCDAARAQLDRNVRPPELEAQTTAELALRFVIDRGAIALPRLHRSGHVAEAVAAVAAPPLSPALHSRLDALKIDPKRDT